MHNNNLTITLTCSVYKPCRDDITEKKEVKLLTIVCNIEGRSCEEISQQWGVGLRLDRGYYINFQNNTTLLIQQTQTLRLKY